MLIEPIETERFTLRCLFPDDDLKNYLSWMKSPKQFPFIESTRADYSELDLILYLNEVNSSTSSVQLSIFEKGSGEHIGNIKFHDIDFPLGCCYVGFLIGVEKWQNRGVAREVFASASSTLLTVYGISLFRLGVESANKQAIRAYTRMGFVQTNKLKVTLGATKIMNFQKKITA